MIYAFTIYLADVDVMTEEMAGRLYDAGCDDGSPFSSCGQAGVGFDREAESLETAMLSAAADVRSAGFVVKRIEVEADDLLAMSASA